ncbi:MAG: hypothetical protein Q9183_006082 [Haloplaca sp. 2 TL-2023]
MAPRQRKRAGRASLGRRSRHNRACRQRLVLTELKIEYLVVAYDDQDCKVKLSLRQADILDALAKDEALCKQGGCVPDLQNVAREGEPLPTFHPEFGRFMLEATPGKPWGIGFKDLLDVEPNMRWRLVTFGYLHNDYITKMVTETYTGER